MRLKRARNVVKPSTRRLASYRILVGNSEERLNGAVARVVRRARRAANLTSEQLADRVETTKSVIEGIEDADCDGVLLAMLEQVAYALDLEVNVRLVPKSTPKAQQRR